MRILALAIIAIALVAMAGGSKAAMDQGAWVKTHLLDARSALPFSFVYGGKPSAELLPTWKRKAVARRLDRNRTQHTITWTDPKTRLEVRCIAIVYREFPAVDWVLYFKNTGEKDTPILEDVQALDTRFSRTEPGEFTVHHIRGSDAQANDFEPITDTIPPIGDLVIHSHGNPTAPPGSPSGNPSVEAMPMFDVDCGGEGVIVALGWSGPWIATLQRDGDRTAWIRAKMDATHLYLQPGEEIRSPRVLLLFWKGDLVDAHNVWRRLILAHYSPRPGGKPFTGLTANCNWSNIMDADRHIQQINWWGDHDIPMECYWMDAAWTDMGKGWFAHQSRQDPNPTLFPNGMRPIADAAHKRGMKYLLWFVPHGLHPEVGIGKDHPEYLGAPFIFDAYPGQKFYALDHGGPEINKFAIGYFSKIISDYGVDIFRQDGTAGWPADTGTDRTGISQIRYTTGFYEFWDGLLRNNPGLMIDNCATGARRIELETMKRSIGLHRSDIPLHPNYAQTVQSYSQGMLPWVPLFGGVVVMTQLSTYSFRSAYCPALLIGWPDEGLPPSVWVTDVAERWKTVDMDLLRKLMKEYTKVRPYVFGDYYPMTPYSRDTSVWVGWQYDRPDLGEGMVQMFRRPDSAEESMRVKPRGLDAKAMYVVTNLDITGATERMGRDLMENGLTIAIAEKPGSAVLTYKKRKSP